MSPTVEQKKQNGTEAAPKQAMPQVSLPKGGGAIQGMGEKFAVNAATGTGSLTVPISVSPGRSGFGPQLSLAYDSGAGNGAFGFGWSLGLPSITRKTDKGLPRYDDANESDVFILSGAEDLVPVLDGTGKPLVKARTLHRVDYDIQYYRPRIEGLFARIERWVETHSGESHWRTISRDNVCTLYGFTPDSRIVDPANARRIFSYLICQTWDDRGNVTAFEYKKEDEARVVLTSTHESNRKTSARTANRYIKHIRYGAVAPWYADWSEVGKQTPLPASWHFEVVFDYGDHSDATPVPTPDRLWALRPDPFTACRPGFEVRTYRRCRRVLMFHHFAEEQNVGNDCLVSSTDFTYSDEVAPTDPRNPIYTFLQSVAHHGYRRDGSGYISRAMPPLEFEYSEPRLQGNVQTLDVDSAANLPVGLGNRWQWVDLDGEGLSGVLADMDGGWGYKRNVSPATRAIQTDGRQVTVARFGGLESVARLPGGRDLGAGLQFLDLAGDGRLDAVSFAQPVPGFFERTTDETWDTFRSFESLPDIDWSSPNLKFVDLTGDGHADVLLTEDDVFTMYASRGEEGFDSPVLVRQPWDEADGPRVVLADGTETIFLGDMSGDGLVDLVRVRNGEVCYWPSLGYGRFGRRVTMDDSPRFGDEERFDPRRVRFADIDGSGTTDLLYVGADGVTVCFNRSGNSWAAPQRLAVFPSADAVSSVQVMDLLGTGTACLVWSSPLPGVAGQGLRYVDLMSSEKPHLLVCSRNNLGAETRMRYAPSTYFYCRDRDRETPWVTRLPYPVHVVERVEVFDFIGRSRFVTRYAYHHGYFDGEEREFRGFGMVEQWDTEEHRGDTAFPAAANWDAASWSPPVRTCTWFHTGAFVEAGIVSRQYAHEYWTEPALRDDAHEAEREAMLLPDTVLPAGLTAQETREAYRALKGKAVRIESYAADGSAQATNPLVVTEQNFSVRREQALAGNRHAVFFAHPREQVTFQYERNGNDPRVMHDVTLHVDPFGNVTRTVAVGYPRRQGYPDPDPKLSPPFRDMLAYDQTRMHIAGTEKIFTNDLTDVALYPDVHRLPAPAEGITAELTGSLPAGQLAGITNFYTFVELEQLWASAWTGAHDVPYEEVISSDVDGSGSVPTAITRRVVERTVTLYRRDDLTGLLTQRVLEPRAIPGESYTLTFTPTQVNRVFGARVSSATLTADGYVQLGAGEGWWAPSGRLFYSPGDLDSAVDELIEATNHFFVPRRAVDPFGGVTRFALGAYDLLPSATADAVGNVTAADNDYRVLQPRRVTDPNGNRMEFAFDSLGLLTGNAVRGKVAESLGDTLVDFEPDLDDAVVQAHIVNPFVDPSGILAGASSRIVYDLLAYHRTKGAAQPDAPLVYKLTRETHVGDLAPNEETQIQHLFSYSDGFGREIQRKAQAEAGEVSADGPNVRRRWVGSGWEIHDNKGNPVRRYEPFFSSTHRFEFGATNGVSTILFYDPSGRVVATLHPNDTWEKVVFEAWRQRTFDTGDTVLTLDPRYDPDVGDYFVRLWGSGPNVHSSWYAQRIGGTFGVAPEDHAAEQDAAKKSERYDSTPSTTHFDARGRTCLTVARDGSVQMANRLALDAEGKPLAVFDALGHRVFEYCVREAVSGGGFRYVTGYDVAGREIYRNGADGGERWMLANAVGNPSHAWDALLRAFVTRYDAAQRPTHKLVTPSAGGTVTYERLVYGEGLPGRNLCGRVFRCYDSAGLIENERYDFKGNLVESSRHFAADYRRMPDWSPLAALTDAAALDAASVPLLAVGDRFVAGTTFDALNRPTQQVTPARVGTRPSVIQLRYNEANLLDGADVWVREATAPTGLLDPSTATVHAVTNIDYNARGQRTAVACGNGVVTTFDYDATTFRLVRLITERPSAQWPGDCPNPAPPGWPGCRAQDLSFSYDAVGNITRIRDDAQQSIFFQNRRVEPANDYSYDAFYRLIRGQGREHLGQQGGVLLAPSQVTDDDGSRCRLPQPGDGMAMGTYTESYDYDVAGNLLQLVHQGSTGRWRRHYAYDAPSRIDAGETANRLSSTSRAGDPQAGPFTDTYGHDVHGNMVAMPHLPGMGWDALDRLQWTTTQVVNNARPAMSFYVYDGSGQRIRKTSDSGAPANEDGTRLRERLYLGPIEIYREFDLDGTTVTLERETLLLDAGNRRVLVLETRTIDTKNDMAPAQMIRFQYANHAGSATMELDQGADVLSYEEYFPYGSTSYQAVRSQTDTPKRFRYSGKERDEESGLCYHGARYYAPWIGRWTRTDPTGITDGLNLYAFVKGSPVNLIDRNGTAGGPLPEAGLLQSTGSRLIGDYPGWNKLWNEAANKVLGPQFGGKTAAENIKLFEAHIEHLKATVGMGSNKKTGTAINVARKTYGKVRSAFGKLAEEAGMSLKEIQVHHGIGTAGELAKAPEKALDAGALHLAKGNAATKGTEHQILHELNQKVDDRLAAAAAKSTKVEAKVATETALKEGGVALKQVASTGGKEALAGAEKVGLKEGAKLLGTKAAKFVPFVGVGVGVGLVAKDLHEGDYASAAWDAAEAIPVVGDVVGAGHLGIVAGTAANSGLGIDTVAAEHGTAVENALTSRGMSKDTAMYFGATAAALSSITVAPQIAIERKLSALLHW